MTYTLSEMIQDALREMGVLYYGKATGGSTTTVVDTLQQNRHGRPDAWKYGTLFVVRDGGGVAPEGEFETITEYVDSTGTFTFATLTAAVASGDRYAFCSSDWKLQTLIEIANDCLRDYKLPRFDRTTLDTVDNKREYASSVSWQNPKPRLVQIQTHTGDSDDNRWVTITQWDYEPSSTPGSDGKILFQRQLTSSRDLRIGYYDYHPRLNAFDDVVDGMINPTLAKWSLVVALWRWKRNDEEMAKAMPMLERAILQHSIPGIEAPAGKVLELGSHKLEPRIQEI